MTKIITVTLNTSIDHFIEVDDFEVNKVFKSKINSFFPSGKGINVSKTIQSLGQEVIALGFAGQSSQDFFNQIKSSFLHPMLTPVQGVTRTNITILDSKKATITHVRNSGFSVNDDNLKKFKETLEQVIEKQDIVVISGSLPKGISLYTYREIIHICHRFDALVILDSSSKALHYGISARPYMIKPNIDELQELVGKDLHGLESEIIAVAEKIALCQEIPLVVVSRGEKGILVVERDSKKVWKAYLPIDTPLNKTISIGSGDSLVGGFATGLKKNLKIKEIISLGVACGVANLISSEPGAITKSDVERFLQQVKIERIS
jgi:1-phosphofructokinase family hexose kinase